MKELIQVGGTTMCSKICQLYVEYGGIAMALNRIQSVPKKCVHTLDAHTSHASRDRIIVFCTDIL
jgi:hypothetical protein